jgi:hypothetical protein
MLGFIAILLTFSMRSSPKGFGLADPRMSR